MDANKTGSTGLLAVSLLTGLCLIGTAAQAFTLQEKTVTTAPTLGTKSATQLTRAEYTPGSMDELLRVAGQQGYQTMVRPTAGGSVCELERTGYLTLRVGKGKAGPSSCEFDLLVGTLKPGFTFKRLDEAGSLGKGAGQSELKRVLGGPAPDRVSLRMAFKGSDSQSVGPFDDTYVEYQIRRVTLEGPPGSCWEAAFGAPCR